VRLLPGVQSAALTNAVPQSNIQPGPQALEIEGVGEPDRVMQADVNVASDRYFETLDVPLLAGRDFRSGDTAEAPPVALINQTMAKFWDGRDPVGRRFRVPQPGQDPAWITVIGVVGDFRLYDVGVDNPAQFYLPFTAQPFGGFRLLVRTAGSPTDVIPSMKAAVFAVDDQTPVEDIQTLSDLRRGRLASPALTAALLGTARASSSCSSASSSASGEPSGSVV
jgi:putative ABC transport system permease protein